MRHKRGTWDRTMGIILAVLASIAIFVFIGGFIQFCSNPDLGVEGFKCRASIIAASRTEELTMGTMSLFKKSCSVIDKQIPLKDRYQVRGMTGIKSPADLTEDEFREVVMRDFTELIARAWWMSAEGDRSNALFDKIDQYISSDNKCLILYGVRIHSPKKYPSFEKIGTVHLESALRYYNKSDVFNKPFPNDMDVQRYITFSGKGGVVILSEPIGLELGGNDAIYGIAVGFKKDAGFTETFRNIIGKGTETLNKDGSFILIAPYDKIANECDVE
ncbi:hypothetical protein AYK26_01825 [Euryarchaeota archaeon SM23-78]|nr:MAG: hypothetical protein AYK26_01825 [Euryarchaeota archaeon SM23-78]MBW3000344.1 hypothetical protein [Candidatus Woesearchaeota archaeon]